MIKESFIEVVTYNLWVDRRIQFKQAEKNSRPFQKKRTNRISKIRNEVEWSIMCIKRVMNDKVEMEVWG